MKEKNNQRVREGGREIGRRNKVNKKEKLRQKQYERGENESVRLRIKNEE